jgi:CRP/FNR family transcriptional regulator
MNQTLPLTMGKHRCPHCTFRKLFLGAGVDCRSLDDLADTATHTYGPYAPGETIYHAGDPCDALFVVQSGSVKSEMVTEDGDVHISGFYLTGEIFGTDGISKKVFPSDVIALERTTVCTLKLAKWTNLCELYPTMPGVLLDEFSDIVLRKSNEMMALHHLHVRARVLLFLGDLLNRVRVRRGMSISQIDLSMSKIDIARYLGITPETLSRNLNNLEKSGVICNRGKTIEILELID